jgi:hypothetical protein
MTRPIHRRALFASLTALALAAVVPARGQDKPGLEGTWGGASGQLTAQVIVTGGAVIGFFWRTDYLEPSDAKPSADGPALAFTFPGGRASLTRTGEATATLEVTEGKAVTRLPLTRD